MLLGSLYIDTKFANIESDWITDADYHGMHDWGEIYFEPYGWLPVDSDIGLMDSKKEEEKWFYLGGMDAYRLIINDDYARDLDPAFLNEEDPEDTNSRARSTPV